MMGINQHSLRHAILAVLGAGAMTAYSGQAAAISPLSLGVIGAGDSATVSGNAPKRAWADYGTGFNYGWTHTAQFRIFQVGNSADLAAGTRFDVNVNLKQNGGASPMNYPGFSIWTSGSAPMVVGSATGGGYGHEWSQVRGPSDGGVAGHDKEVGVNPSLGSNGWMKSNGGTLVSGHDGWIGYANAGYSFTNGDGDKVQGLFAGASNPGNVGQYGGGASDPLNGTALANVNENSPYVYTGFATLSAGEAMLTLQGLKAGYYLIGWAGSCPDDNANGQNCGTAAGQAYRMTISNTGVSAVPLPGAVWLFGSALFGVTAFGRKKPLAV
ncbi:hypothetical protein NP603_08525 [Methylomonas sp. SURF-1]|uniref:Secreted protein with PEP-CTERM sorting signal n=1 Tax=Methylomonas aurea TaxID=2952224 RepID=A0ABT1UG49_9GAMM|nr:hypothetical protein [Methylomonas sp. SURF-1]MCQ8181150.1 hypothetical protein [Methylomonas sp. SURF-1]